MLFVGQVILDPIVLPIQMPLSHMKQTVPNIITVLIQTQGKSLFSKSMKNTVNYLNNKNYDVIRKPHKSYLVGQW